MYTRVKGTSCRARSYELEIKILNPKNERIVRYGIITITGYIIYGMHITSPVYSTSHIHTRRKKINITHEYLYIMCTCVNCN